MALNFITSLARKKNVKPILATLQFAIRETKKEGIVKYAPIVKSKGFWGRWISIIKLAEGQFILADLEVKDLSRDDCKKIIEEYKVFVQLQQVEEIIHKID